MHSTSFLILHGIDNYRPPEHWQFQLAAHLSERGHQVRYPSLPDPDQPRFDAWQRVLHEQIEQLDGPERVVICHSLACLLWFRAAPGLGPDQRVDRLLLVSPPASERLPKEGASFRLDRLDGRAVAASVGTTIRIAHSDNDPYNPLAGHQRYIKALGAEADLIVGGGHITPENGYGVWPSLETWCLRPDARLSADGAGRSR